MAWSEAVADSRLAMAATVALGRSGCVKSEVELLRAEDLAFNLSHLLSTRSTSSFLPAQSPIRSTGKDRLRAFLAETCTPASSFLGNDANRRPARRTGVLKLPGNSNGVYISSPVYRDGCR